MDIDTERLVNAGYLPDNDVLTVINLAMHLAKPVLVEGPAGTGKTSVAIAAAKALNRDLIRIQCYEGITAEQVIGEFNYKRQLLAIELSKGNNVPRERDNLMEDIFRR